MPLERIAAASSGGDVQRGLKSPQLPFSAPSGRSLVPFWRARKEQRRDRSRDERNKEEQEIQKRTVLPRQWARNILRSQKAALSLLPERVSGAEGASLFSARAKLDIPFGREHRTFVGALPQTPPEALPLDSARGNRPLTLFGSHTWARFPCPFRVFNLFPFPLFLR